MLDFERDDASDKIYSEVSEIRDLIESNDEILMELAEELHIQFDCDGSVLTSEQRQSLSYNCLGELGYIPDFPIPYVNMEEPNDGGMTRGEREALGDELDYDGSRLTPEQKRALFKSYWAYHLKMIDLRSPQYYGDKSQCLSVSETAWPGHVTYLEAEKLKRGYIEPEDLIERLRKLKSSDNFELREFDHPRMGWKSPTPLQEKGFEMGPNWPPWVMDQLYAITDMEMQLEPQGAAQHRQEVRDRWAAFESGVELTSFPDLHLLRDMGCSPGGTLFPWDLVKGLMTLRERADEIASKSFDEEHHIAMARREEAINCWRERYPEPILTDDPLSIYRTWPVDLTDVLDEIDREMIRCGREKYVTILRNTESKMQALVAFWRSCGLVNGQRIPPSLWWQEKLRMIETSRWMSTSPQFESDIALETPAQKASNPECSGQKEPLRDSALGAVMTPEETLQLQGKSSREIRRRPRTKITTTEGLAIWQDRLRPRMKTGGQTSWCGRLRSRSDAVGIFCDRTKATIIHTGKPMGIVKRKRSSKKMRSAATKGQAIMSTV